jgi:Gp37 protein
MGAGAVILDSPWAGSQFLPPSPLDIATIETAIVNQLRSQIGTVEIAHFPDKPSAYRLTHRIGAALVVYRGATYGEQIDTAAIAQVRTLKFDVTLVMRDLGWSFGGEASGTSPGAYAVLEEVRTALTGFRVPGCRKMYPVRDSFEGRDPQGGVWIYAITFALDTMAVERSATENFPLFVRGTAQETGGLTAVTVGPAAYTFDVSGQITLPNGNVSSVVVSNPIGGAVYTQGVDYLLDAVNGVITLAAGGAIPAGATVNVAYAYSEVAATASAVQGAPYA